MSNNRMLALVAILAGGLMVGACGDAVTGPEGPYADAPIVGDVSNPRDGVTELPPGALVKDPDGRYHGPESDDVRGFEIE